MPPSVPLPEARSYSKRNEGHPRAGCREDGPGPVELAPCRGSPLLLDLWHFIYFFNLAAATEIPVSQCRTRAFNLFALLNVQPNFCLLHSILGVVGRHKENMCLAFSFAKLYQVFF